MNDLIRHNDTRRREVEAFRDQLLNTHAQRSFPRFDEYPLPKLKTRIADALSERWGKGRLTPQFDLIDRATFGGDIALKLPQLLADGGPKAFISQHLPWIVEILKSPAFADALAAIQVKGMYINITLSDWWMIAAVQAVAALGDKFGSNDKQAAQKVVVDYSSPNVAKVLHAGHIRSTIIGHVLANLYEACGALVYRINHINDFGGFGYTLEGYRRFQERFPAGMGGGERLIEIYRIRRTLERLLETATSFDQRDAADRELLERYFPHATSREALAAAAKEYEAASDTRFAALEAGDPAEVELWEQMVQWSMADFEQFYDSLDIHIDLTLGESFYLQAGDNLVDESIAAGTAILYTEETAAADLAVVNAMDIAETERVKRAEAIRKDLGAIVVRLGGDERYVVRRSDGRSIYATRDLGAIRLRTELFHPTAMTYVVGQEQRIHFSRLFKAAYALGIAALETVSFLHVFFGFYVDAKTGRKLSSRNSVTGVNQLLTESVSYFRAKSAERGVINEADLEMTARQMAIGSLVFNDLKQDVKGPVEIDTSALETTIADFEKSGGAYVVYSACRARSILRKYGQELPPIGPDIQYALDPQEASLILKIQQVPERLLAAAEQANPTLLIRHLLEIATIYNSYYNRAQVITSEGADPVRLLFTKAVEQSLTNGLRLCHVECPATI